MGRDLILQQAVHDHVVAMLSVKGLTVPSCSGTQPLRLLNTGSCDYSLTIVRSSLMMTKYTPIDLPIDKSGGQVYIT